jgi:hypothetical protein
MSSFVDPTVMTFPQAQEIFAAGKYFGWISFFINVFLS